VKIHPSYLRTPELHISIFIRQTTIAIGLTHNTRMKSEAMINTSHLVYIDRSSAGITTWWISDVRGKDGSFARSEEAQFDPSYHFWSKHVLVHMQCTPGKWHLIILVTHTQKHRKA